MVGSPVTAKHKGDGAEPKVTRRVSWPALPAWGLYLTVGGISLLLADIPFCRVHYQARINWYLTPRKEQLLGSVGDCANAMLASAEGRCKSWCSEVKNLSDERLSTLLNVRDWHFLGRLAAELFDERRIVEQNEDKVQQLFGNKTCARVLRSVDKSNALVNWLCIGVTLASLFGTGVVLWAAWCGYAGSTEDRDATKRGD